MKRFLITSIFAAAVITYALGGTQHQMKNKKNISMAEQDFNDCAGNRPESRYDINNNFYFPEIIIIDFLGNKLACGDRDNEIIREMIKMSDYIAEIHETYYYRMEESVIRSGAFFVIE